jgi:hypothetical protein
MDKAEPYRHFVPNFNLIKCIWKQGLIFITCFHILFHVAISLFIDIFAFISLLVQSFVFGLQVKNRQSILIYFDLLWHSFLKSLLHDKFVYSVEMLFNFVLIIAFTNSYLSSITCFCFIIRGHNLALIIHSAEFVSLDLHANLIILWDPWVTVHLLLL